MKSILKWSRSREEGGLIHRALFAVVAVLAIAFYPNVFAQTCDVVIKNGSVMDPETNFDGVRNVGIKQSAQVARDKDDE
jgi:hypothetical protein